jgi:hypothetical protein
VLCLSVGGGERGTRDAASGRGGCFLDARAGAEGREEVGEEWTVGSHACEGDVVKSVWVMSDIWNEHSAEVV